MAGHVYRRDFQDWVIIGLLPTIERRNSSSLGSFSDFLALARRMDLLKTADSEEIDECAVIRLDGSRVWAADLFAASCNLDWHKLAGGRCVRHWQYCHSGDRTQGVKRKLGIHFVDEKTRFEVAFSARM
jgi:hypothetical protein